MKIRHVLPFVFFPVLMVCLLVLGVRIYSRTTGQAIPRLAVVPPEDIPPAIIEHVAKRSDNTIGSVWRACWEQDGDIVAVRTCERVGGYYPPTAYVEWFVFRDLGSGLEYVAHDQNQADWSDYFWVPAQRSALEFADRVHYAIGWALSADARQIAGTTTSGRVFEAPVVNGFWFLRVHEHVGPEIFESAVVKNEQGEVVYTYPKVVYDPIRGLRYIW